MDLIRIFGGHPLDCFAAVTITGRPITKADVIEGNEGIGPLAGDTVRAMYTMPGGSTAYFNSVRNAGGKPSRFGLQILGTAGVLEMQSGYLPSVKFLADPGWSSGRSGIAWQNVSSAGIGQAEPLTDGGLIAGNVLIARDLLAAIGEHRQPLGNMYEARGALEMIVAVFASQQAGHAVPLPLAERDNPLTKLT
jgi:predicted dehydrogenase